MLLTLKKLFSKKDLLSGNFGIERETLRNTISGALSNTKHPEVFGGKLSNPYITTDFSESQIEMITPSFDNVEECYDFLNILYDIVALELKDEYLWPQSMPCNIPDDEEIPIAEYDDTHMNKEARMYREFLFNKYGAKKQLISGIHFNFSFKEEMIQKLYNELNIKDDYKIFKNNIYLKVTRNYLKYRWLLIYLLGATPAIHESYSQKCARNLNKIHEDTFNNDYAVSYRNSECGYKNKEDLYPEYSSIDQYVKSIERFKDEGKLTSHKELYSQIRLKAKDNINLLESLLKDGINYIEIRSIDVNPFDKCGISLEDLRFLQIFMLYLLLKDENLNEEYQEEGLYNQQIVARFGLTDLKLKRDGNEILKSEWAKEILNEIRDINNVLELGREDIINAVAKKIENPHRTYAYLLTTKIKEYGYIDCCVNLSKQYYKEAYDNRYKLLGYENLELSTQILIKEAIKRGIEVEILDEADNFICLKKDNNIQYVKQATKTSIDNYITVLAMENKVVTKKILNKNNIKVPKGFEYDSLEDAKEAISKFINRPIVIKPKSTNFGLGISIFPNGCSEKDAIDALNIAFKEDKTVLVEEFINGKEYRFLVIGDETIGILHRVPANVVGDGVSTITELVNIKNKDSLRGTGYKTPLEKIKLDKSAALFLKQNNLDFDYIPNKDEIVYLRENSNISTGGDSIDYTDLIDDKFKKIAVEATKAIGAKICGVDMIISDLDDINSNYAIIELNFNPAIHIHSYPFKGKERKIAKYVLDALGY